MDIFTPTKKQVSHKLELYTQHLIVSGTVKTPFKRISDVLNKGDSQFLKVDDAVITPFGKPPTQKPVEGPAMVSLAHQQLQRADQRRLRRSGHDDRGCGRPGLEEHGWPHPGLRPRPLAGVPAQRPALRGTHRLIIHRSPA